MVRLSDQFSVLLLAFALGWPLTLVAQAPGNSTTPTRGGNPAAAMIKNPVPGTPESIAAGRSTFAWHCARCHGKGGKGDGPTTLHGERPADFTDDHWVFGSSDGEIFTVIRDGTSVDSESFAERLSETEMWNLVNFIRTLGAPVDRSDAGPDS